MAKVLFIQPHKTVLTSDLSGRLGVVLAERTDRFARAVPSLPAMCVLGALEERHEANFIDATADDPKNIFPYNKDVHLIGLSDEQLCDIVRDSRPDLVALTSMFTAEYFSVNRVLRLIKDNFDLPVVVGGHQATLRPDWHLEEGADFVVLGEGEQKINELVGVVGQKDYSLVEGIVSKKDKTLARVSLRGSGGLDKEWAIETVVKRKDGSYRYPLSVVTRNPKLYMPRGVSSGEGAGVLYASRGCPYGCGYCNATDRDGKKIRHMSLEKMVDLTKEFMSLGAVVFHNESDTFGIHPIDREYLEWVAQQRRSGERVGIVNTNSFFAKYFFPRGKFSPRRVDLLRGAGIQTATVSIESFNPKFNNRKLEGITPEMFADCFDYMDSQGMGIDVYMMYLFPWQTPEEFIGDIKLIEGLRDKVTTTTWRSLMYFPGTRYYDWATRFGKFREEGYKRELEKGYSFYHVDKRFNFSEVRNPPSPDELP